MGSYYNQPNQGYNNYQGMTQSYNPGYQQGVNQGYPMNSNSLIMKIQRDIQINHTCKEPNPE